MFNDKVINAVYLSKKSWFKIKSFIEVPNVVALEEGTGKNEGLLGVSVVEGEDDGKFRT